MRSMRPTAPNTTSSATGSTTTSSPQPTSSSLATFWRQVTPGQTYWRCIVPARRLPAKVLAFQRDDVQDTDPVSFPRQEGTAVWCYITHLPKGILMAAMQEQGIRCLVEVDDNYIVGAPHGLSKWT